MKKGFTLIEMAVVLLIIGILAGIVLRNIGGQSIQARDTRRVSDLRILTNYLAQYLAKQGQFPTTADVSPWANLSNAFSNVGINVPLPVPPTNASNDVYNYYPCQEGGVTNHFIVRARLEQSPTQSPRLYEGSVSSTPSGWSCSVDCSSSSNYYCIAQ